MDGKSNFQNGDHSVLVGTPGAPGGPQFRILELALDIGSGEVSLLVKTKLMHADKVENGDELMQVGNVAIENLTVEKLMEMMATPSREVEGYGVLLSFKKSNGVIYRFLGETMKLSVGRIPVHSPGGHDIAGGDIVYKAPFVENNAAPYIQNHAAATLTGQA